MKRLLIDANPAIPFIMSGHVNGIGRTNVELIRALNSIPADEIPFRISLCTHNLKGINASALTTRFKTHHLYLRNRDNWNRAIAFLHIRELMFPYDLMHITHNFEYVANPDKCVVTIHDAMMFSYPEPFLGHDWARKNYPPFARKVRAIITCSENSKREIAEYMGVNPDKIFVAPWGVDHELLRPHATEPCRYTSGKPYFIAVSCDRGRKNTIAVVKAFIKFLRNNPEHQLVLVWRTPSDEVLRLLEENPEVKNKIHFASNISNEVLADLYAGATCSFFPSRYEGFGLPIAESMACGTPVVTCRNSSLEEVGGDVAMYVDPDDIDSLSEYMEQFENGSLSKESISEECLAQSMNFTWERCSRLTLDVYRKCLDI